MHSYGIYRKKQSTSPVPCLSVIVLAWLKHIWKRLNREKASTDVSNGKIWALQPQIEPQILFHRIKMTEEGQKKQVNSHYALPRCVNHAVKHENIPSFNREQLKDSTLLRINRNIYGKRSAPRVYSIGLRKHLMRACYEQNAVDQNVYTKRLNKRIVKRAVSVNDFVFIVQYLLI